MTIPYKGTTHILKGGVCPDDGSHVSRPTGVAVIDRGQYGGWICLKCRAVFFPTLAIPRKDKTP